MDVSHGGGGERAAAERAVKEQAAKEQAAAEKAATERVGVEKAAAEKAAGDRPTVEQAEGGTGGGGSEALEGRPRGSYENRASFLHRWDVPEVVRTVMHAVMRVRVCYIHLYRSYGPSEIVSGRVTSRYEVAIGKR